MTQEKIIEGNKLIAEFMKLNKKIYGETGITYYINNIPYQTFKLKYNSSWDWLMPVVEKIELINRTTPNNHPLFRFYYFRYLPNEWVCEILNLTTTETVLESDCVETKIKATWLAVVEFIKWYNKNK